MKNSLYLLVKQGLDKLVERWARQQAAIQPRRVVSSFPAPPPYQPTLPANIAALTGPLVPAFQALIKFRPYHVYEIGPAYISWDGAVFRNFRLFPPSIVHTRFLRRFQDTFLLRQWLGAKVELPSQAAGIIVAHDQWSAENYYHWLIDTLPRLLLVQDAFPQHQLLLPQPLPPKAIPDYITHSAQALGFTRFFPLHTRQLLYAQHIVVPELTAESLFQNPALVQRVRRILLAHFGPSTSQPTRRIYASRSTQRVRKLLNEDELLPLLAAHGFEVVHFEKLNFLEQIALMRETSVFAGVHGANMANMLFLPPRATVVELLNAEHGDICYFRLASCLELPYYCVPCSPSHPTEQNQSNLMVNVDFMRQLLTELPAATP